jgi:hypothetical protein
MLVAGKTSGCEAECLVTDGGLPSIPRRCGANLFLCERGEKQSWKWCGRGQRICFQNGLPDDRGIQTSTVLGHQLPTDFFFHIIQLNQAGVRKAAQAQGRTSAGAAGESVQPGRFKGAGFFGSVCLSVHNYVFHNLVIYPVNYKTGMVHPNESFVFKKSLRRHRARHPCADDGHDRRCDILQYLDVIFDPTPQHRSQDE